MKIGNMSFLDIASNKGLLKRTFSIKTGHEPAELLTLSIELLDRMRMEYIEAFNELF